LSRLRIEREHAVHTGARILGDLPFLPGNIEIDRGEIFARRSLLR